MNYYILVINGEYATIPLPETENVFIGKTTEELAALGWYFCIGYGVIDEETQYYSEGVIDEELKTVTYTVIDKTPEELAYYHNIISKRKRKILLEKAKEYESFFLYGSIISIVTTLVASGNDMGLAVKDWMDSIRTEYFSRRDEVLADWSVEINEDYSNLGDMPYTEQQLKTEYDTLFTPDNLELLKLENKSKMLFRLFMSLSDALVANGTVSVTDFTVDERALYQQAKLLKPKIW